MFPVVPTVTAAVRTRLIVISTNTAECFLSEIHLYFPSFSTFLVALSFLLNSRLAKQLILAVFTILIMAVPLESDSLST